MKIKMMLGVVGLVVLMLFAANIDAKMTNYPNGITSFGAPVLPDENGDVWGTAYFVSTDTSIASNGNKGTSRDIPFLTIQAAINACTTGKGDRIYVQNGSYTENLTITKDDITIIGQSVSDTIVIGATDATDVLVITGNEVVIKGIQFDGYDTGSDISLIKVGTVGTATSGVKVIGCQFSGNEYHVEAFDCSDMFIGMNEFLTLDDVTDGACVNLSGSDNCVVTGNEFKVDANSDGIIHDDADGLVVSNNIAIGDDDTGASAGAFVFVTGITATDTLILDNNRATLFGALLAESGTDVAAHGYGTADLTPSGLVASGDNNYAFGCTTGFDTSGLT